MKFIKSNTNRYDFDFDNINFIVSFFKYLFVRVTKKCLYNNPNISITIVQNSIPILDDMNSIQIKKSCVFLLIISETHT